MTERIRVTRPESAELMERCPFNHILSFAFGTNGKGLMFAEENSWEIKELAKIRQRTASRNERTP